MTDLLGPASAPNAVTTRVAEYRTFGNIDTWFKPCSSPASQDGTQLQAPVMNGILAQLRGAIRGNGNLGNGTGPVVPEVNTVDGMLLLSTQLLIARGQPNFGTDTGSADALAVAPATPWPEYKAGARIWVIKSSAAGANATAAPSLAVSGLAAVTIVRRDGSALLPGDLQAGVAFCAEYDGTYFRLVSLTWGEIAAAVQSGKWVYGAATGTGNAAAVTLFPSQSPIDGTEILVKWPATNTAAAPMLNVAGQGTKPVVRQGGGQIQPGDLAGYVSLIYDATLTAWRVNGLVASDFAVIVPTVARPQAKANQTFYVATTGSDANPGTQASPFLTPTRAVQAAQAYDYAGLYSATIQFANGTYAGGGIGMSGGLVGCPGQLNFVGNPTSPGSVLLNTTAPLSGVSGNPHCFNTVNGASINLNGFSLQSTNGNALYAQGTGSIIGWQNCIFGACPNGYHMSAVLGGEVIIGGSNVYTVNGGAQAHLYTDGSGSNIVNNGGSLNVTVNGTPAFSLAFAAAYNFSNMKLPGITYAGAATGYRYLANSSLINTYGGGASYFPGSNAGSTGQTNYA